MGSVNRAADSKAMNPTAVSSITHAFTIQWSRKHEPALAVLRTRRYLQYQRSKALGAGLGSAFRSI